MIKKRLCFYYYIISVIDTISNINGTKKIFKNLRSIEFSIIDALVKLYQFYLSKRLTVYINDTIPRDAGALTAYLDNSVKISNEHYWQTCLQHDGPVLFVTPHYGPFAVGCLKASRDFNGKKMVNAFYDPPEKNSSTAPYQNLLSALGYNFTPIFNDRKGLVTAIRALQKHEALTMMPDVYQINNQAIYVPFFSHLTFAMTGTAFLARKTSALLVHAYVKHKGLGRVLIELEEPYKMEVSDNIQYDIYKQTCRTMESLETKLKSAPEHWMYLPNFPSRLTSKYSKDANEIDSIIQSLSISLNIMEHKKA